MIAQEIYMKAKRFLTITFVLCASACASRTPADKGGVAIVPDAFTVGKVIDTVWCRDDSSQTYALYIPVRGNAQPLPVLYLFDPHAAGALPLRKYKALADTYGFILIGSNNSKNGNDWSMAERIWYRLSQDTRSRLKIDSSRIYTGGFSGGAKVAGYVALQHPGIKGVIANGAGLPDETAPGNFPFSFTAVAGEGDMNRSDLISFSAELDKSATRHRLLLFDGKHEWAPENTIELALLGLQFDAMRNGTLAKDEALIRGFEEKSKKKVEDDIRTKQLIRAEQECVLAISCLDGLVGGADWFRQKLGAVQSSAEYQQEKKAQEALLVKEQQIKAEYQQHFQQEDMTYWTNVISDLQVKADSKITERAMYQRLLAYLSLAFYSISNHLINANENGAADHFVLLYKMADPTNSEAWYFSAVLHARNNQPQAATGDLLKAVGYGFNDEGRMMRQLEFQSLAGQMDLRGIKSKMKKN